MSDSELQEYKTPQAAMQAARRAQRLMTNPAVWDVFTRLGGDSSKDVWTWEMTHHTLDQERIAIHYYPSTKQYQASSLIDNEDYGFEQADKSPQVAAERLLADLHRRRQAQADKLGAELTLIRKAPVKPTKNKCTVCGPTGLKQGTCPRCGRKVGQSMIGRRGKQGGK